MKNSTRQRRTLLKALVAAPAVGAPLLLAGARTGQAQTPDRTLAAATAGLISSNVCSLMPQTTEGPYYLDQRLLRQDITEGRPGIPLRLQLQVITADCSPVAEARVDVWQCDAQGDYSGYAQMGADGDDTRDETFLRGTQMTNAQGIVTFDTVYPGWYRGRTTHIHYKVFLGERTTLTSQLFLPDALSEYVYLHAPAYARQQQRDTLNSIDDIAAEAGQGAYAAIREQQDRYIAALVVDIDPKAQWSERGQGMKMGDRPPGPPPGTAGQRPPGPPPGGPGGPHGQRDEQTRIFPGN